MSDSLLELRGVTKRFGGTVAADDLTFDVMSERLTALIGPNGAGKTTIVNLVAGRFPPDAGEVRYDGQRLPRGPHRCARAGIGRLFQEVRIFGGLTALENVSVAVPGQRTEGVAEALLRPDHLRADRARTKNLAMAALERVGLSDRAESPGRALSYGQKKLVAIARLLAAGSRLLLLDEPASGLNPRMVESLAELLRGLLADGLTLLLIEHNMALVRDIADDVVLLESGRCRLTGPVAEVWDSAVLQEVYLAPDG